MKPQESAIIALARLLERAGVEYMLIGGHANAIWGHPRATIDVDMTVWAQEADASRLVAALSEEFTCLVADPSDFVRDRRVLPFSSKSGVAVDLIFGLLPFEQQAIERAKAVPIAGTLVRVCTAEDLVLMKIFSDRPRDLGDAEGVVRARFGELDLDYLEPRIRELSDLLTSPEILERWNNWKQDVLRRRRSD